MPAPRDPAPTLGGSPDPVAGLTAAQVAERVARGQVNDVPARSSRSTWEIVRGNTFTAFNGLLGSLLAVVLLVGPLQDGCSAWSSCPTRWSASCRRCGPSGRWTGWP